MAERKKYRKNQDIASTHDMNTDDELYKAMNSVPWYLIKIEVAYSRTSRRSYSEYINYY